MPGMIGLGNINYNSKPTPPPSPINTDGSINWNKNGYSSKKILDQLTDQGMKDQIMQGASIGDLVKQYLPEEHQALAKRLVSYYGESSDDIINYLNSAAGGDDALMKRARGFASNIAANGHTAQFADTFKNIFQGGSSKGNTLSQGTIDAISGGGYTDNWQKQIDDLNNQKQTYIQGALHAAGTQSYMDKQKILETQRKYGITGAVASAQMQDYELKNKNALSETSIKAGAQWDQLHGSTISSLQQAKGSAQASSKLGFLQQLANGKFKTVEDAKTILSGTSADASFKAKMTDDVLKELMDNKSGVSTYLHAQQNTQDKLPDTKK